MIYLEKVNDFEEFFEKRIDFLKERYDEAKPLYATDRDIDIDSEVFQVLSDTDALIGLSIYEEETFIGYCALTMIKSMLSKGKVDVRIEHLALSEDSRKKGVASEVLEEIEQLLKSQGIDQVSLVLPETEQHKLFADSNSYKKDYVVYTKKLEEA